jgi:nucleoside 2-deoxyribosyltransferase
LTNYIIEPIFESLPLVKSINFIRSETSLKKQIEKRADFYAFVKQVEKRFPEIRSLDSEYKDFRFWRSIALSLSKDNSLVYRFTFISLLNLGIAVDLILISTTWLLLWLFRDYSVIQNVKPVNYFVLSFMIVATLPFLERYYQFNRRSLQIPFSIALATLLEKNSNDNDFHKNEVNLASKTIRVYLAGGFYSNWQGQVKESLTGFNYLDPSEHNLSNPAEYTAWDLEAIRQCDIVFAFLEANNPGGYALSLELGYAKALNKIIIFVDEKTASLKKPYFDMLRAASTEVFNSLDEGIRFMESLKTIYS